MENLLTAAAEQMLWNTKRFKRMLSLDDVSETQKGSNERLVWILFLKHKKVQTNA